MTIESPSDSSTPSSTGGKSHLLRARPQVRGPAALALFVGVLVLSLVAPARAQTATLKAARLSPGQIRLILVQGNDKTKKEVILREMKLKPGDKLDPEELERDRLRIQNLGIFNRVEIDIVPTAEGAILVVSVSEMWYIFPYPIIFRNERNWSRLSVGAGLLYTNFRGRREVIDFSGWLGFNPAIRLNYSNPWIFGKAKFYTKFSIFGRRIRNQTFTVLDSVVNENQFGFNITLGKRFGHFTYLDFNTGYRQLTLSPKNAGRTLSASGKDPLPTFGLSFRYDSRDLWEYPHKGEYLNLWATKTGWFGNTVDYLRYGADLRKYLPIGKTTLAFRAAGNFSGGEIPVYEQVHFGFLTRIRGHFSERSIGENLVIGSAEFRFPIIPITYHSWEAMESMGQYGTNLRFGVSGGIFFDTGNIWFRRQNQAGTTFDANNFISGWGGGAHIFLPYNMLLRLEYGFDERWNGQFIVDALVAF